MKNLIKGAVLLLLTISFAACQQATDPVSPVSMDKSNVDMLTQTGSGTFQITFTDARASVKSKSIAGTISFEFDNTASRYKYDGRINSESDSRSGIFVNTGTFERKGDFINLVDDPEINSITNSQTLGLNGDFHYTVRGTQTIIEGDTNQGHLKIILD